MTMRGARGFTLIELMITLAIVAILAAIAIPNYNEYVRRSRRNEAREAVMTTSAALEKYFLNNNEYTDVIGAGGLTGTGLLQQGTEWQTRSGFYKVAISNNGETPPADWLITATAIGSQAVDTECTSFTYALTGARTATGSGTDPTAECWD